MTRATTVRVSCNDCGTERQGQVGESVTQLRAALGRVGWQAKSAADIDVCPTCFGKRALRAAGDTGGAAS